nr:MAG TPA: hypothetical protein [Caudoviricetes sp.]
MLKQRLFLSSRTFLLDILIPPSPAFQRGCLFTLTPPS